MCIRFFDIVLSLLGLIALFPIIFIIFLLGILDTGSPLFIQKRLGKNQTYYQLFKFRTMSIGTAQVGTHLAKKSDITLLGHFLRKSKLDELPQLVNVLLGEMSLIGPRPGLPTQEKLRDEREKRGVFNVRPGISGLGQVNEVDMSTPRKLSRYDQLMIKNMTTCFYFQMIIATALGKGYGDKVET